MVRRTKIQKQRNSIRRAIRGWFIQHAQACIFSLGQMAQNLTGSLLTTAVIGISLSLPAGFYILLNNAQRLSSGWEGALQITLFMQQEITDQKVRELADSLAARDDIERVRLIDREQALEEYKQHSGFGEVLEILEENPLPAVLLVYPAQDSIRSGAGEGLINELRQLTGVDSAQYDRQWAKRLFTIIEIIQRLVMILATLLAVAVLLIIGNTIRLSIYNRRTEIEINKLFGATNAYIQRPFLYSGLIHGVGGSIMAWILLIISLKLLDQPVLRLSGLYAANFQLTGLGMKESLLLLAVGAALGLAGSWLSVQRHLKEIEPC